MQALNLGSGALNNRLGMMLGGGINVTLRTGLYMSTFGTR
jgi:hypothetical protein